MNGIALEDVQTAKAAFEARGETPSSNKILAAIGHGSKKTVLKFLRQLASAPRDAGPVPADPGEAATRATWQRFAAHQRQGPAHPPALAPARDPVADAEARLVEAREDLLQLKGYYLCTREMPVDGLLHGSLHPHDPIHQQALADVDAAKREYDRCWAALAEAMVQRQQQVQQAQVARQETWVQQHRPELVTELRRAEETYAKVQALPDDAQKPKAHYAARFVLQQARAAYQQALALAPVPSTNGTHAEEA